MNYRDRGYADICVARTLISPFGNPTNDEGVNDIAAYHVQQAIEKEIKHILHDICGADDTARSFKTHNLSDLIGQVEEYGISIPEELIDLASDISDWEAATRYSGSVIANIEEIKEAIAIYERFTAFVKNQIEVDGGKEDAPAHAEKE